MYYRFRAVRRIRSSRTMNLTSSGSRRELEFGRLFAEKCAIIRKHHCAMIWVRCLTFVSRNLISYDSRRFAILTTVRTTWNAALYTALICYTDLMVFPRYDATLRDATVDRYRIALRRRKCLRSECPNNNANYCTISIVLIVLINCEIKDLRSETYKLCLRIVCGIDRP